METIFVAKVSIHKFFRLSNNISRTIVWNLIVLSPKRAILLYYLWLAKLTELSKGATKTQSLTLKKLFRYFIQGIIILAPIGITAYVLYWLFEQVDGILRPAVFAITKVNIPGLGFVIILLFVILVGWFSSNFLMGSAINFFDQLMEKTPGVKFIYSSTKDFFEAFAGDKKRFNKAVLANVFAEEVWIIGFLTDEEMRIFDMGADKVAVYVPQAYNFAGQLYILPREKVRKIEHLNSGEAMKYAVTGGVVDLDAERSEHTKSELKTNRD